MVLKTKELRLSWSVWEYECCICIWIWMLCERKRHYFLGHSVVSYSTTPWTVAHQALLSMGILQTRILEWVAISFSRGSSQPRNQTQVSRAAGDSLPSEPPGKPTSAKSRNKEHKLWLCSLMIQGLVLQDSSSYNKSLNLNGSQQPIWKVGIINRVLATSQRNSEYLTKGDFKGNGKWSIKVCFMVCKRNKQLSLSLSFLSKILCWPQYSECWEFRQTSGGVSCNNTYLS